MREVCPHTREQQCWWHRIGIALAALPKFAHASAKAATVDIYNAEDKQHVPVAVKAFERDFGAKFPKVSLTGRIPANDATLQV